MAKLINADETVKAIIKRFGIGNERYLLPSERAIVDVIESMPTVDAVPIDWIEEWYLSQDLEYVRIAIKKMIDNWKADIMT